MVWIDHSHNIGLFNNKSRLIPPWVLTFQMKIHKKCHIFTFCTKRKTLHSFTHNHYSRPTNVVNNRYISRLLLLKYWYCNFLTWPIRMKALRCNVPTIWLASHLHLNPANKGNSVIWVSDHQFLRTIKNVCKSSRTLTHNGTFGVLIYLK